MALSVAQLAAYLGIESPDTEQTAELQLLLDASVATINDEAPDAPTSIKDLATQRFAAYQHDQPFAARGQAYANAFLNSGAGSVLSRWRVRRL